MQNSSFLFNELLNQISSRMTSYFIALQGHYKYLVFQLTIIILLPIRGGEDIFQWLTQEI